MAKQAVGKIEIEMSFSISVVPMGLYDSQPIPHLYSSAQANSAHVFRCRIGQIKCAELVKNVTRMI